MSEVCWEVPGGGVEFGETLAAATVREIKEELNVDIDIIEPLLAIDHIIPAEGEHWVATPFLATIKPGQKLKILEPQKCEAIDFFPLDNLPTPLSITTKLNLEVYEHYRQLRGNTDAAVELSPA